MCTLVQLSGKYFQTATHLLRKTRPMTQGMPNLTDKLWWVAWIAFATLHCNIAGVLGLAGMIRPQVTGKYRLSNSFVKSIFDL